MKGPDNFYGLLVLGGLLCTLNLSGQNIQKYEGNYLLKDSMAGQASFEYYTKGRDTVKHGNFSFQTAEYNYNQDNLFTGLEMTGPLRKGKKNGNWTHRFARFNLGTKPRMKGHEVIFKGSGKEELVSGNFKAGQANGKWQAIEQRIANGQPKDTSFLAKVAFDDGIMIGPIKAYGENDTLNGKIKDNGFLEGTWTIRQDSANHNLKEQRIYDDGVLKNHRVLVEGDTLSLNHSGLDTSRDGEEEKWETMPVDSRYLQILTLTFSGDRDSLQNNAIHDSTGYKISAANAFLKKSLRAFSIQNGQVIWDRVSGSDPVKLPKVRVRKYPFSGGEKQKLQSIETRFDSIQKLITTYFEDAQIDISRHAHKEVKHYYKVMEIHSNRLKKLQPAVRLFSMPAFEYINRDKAMKNLIPEIAYPDSFSFQFENQKHTRSHPFPAGLEKAEKLDSLYKHLQQTHKDIAQTTKEVDRILEKYKKEKRLAGKEEQLIQARDTVLALFNPENTREDYNQYHRRLTDSIRSFYDRTFKDYASLSLEAKINKVETVIACFKEGLKLYDALKVLPEHLEHLDERYTRTIWNPQTFTHMDERIKKPIYKAFDERLLPFMLSNAQNELACGKIEDQAENFDLLYNRMLELRNQKTQEIEKQIKKARTPEAILSVFGADVNID